MITVAQYAEIHGITSSQARMHLECMTAERRAARYTHPRRAAMFALLDAKPAEPMRIKLKDEDVGQKKGFLVTETRQERLGRVLGFLRTQTESVTSADVRDHFGFHSLQFALTQLYALKRNGVIDDLVVDRVHFWFVIDPKPAKAGQKKL